DVVSGCGAPPWRPRLLALPRPPELVDEAVTFRFLHVDLSLEGVRIVQTEELVGVPREAVAAGHLAATIRVHGPPEGHRPRVELVHEILGVKLVIFNAPTLVEREPESWRHSRGWNSWDDRHVLSLSGHRKTRGASWLPGLCPIRYLAPPASAAATPTRPR